jgi:UDP-3-O-[3-hydroxymyristoyl] glucosamine N-acyltransferase
LAGGLAVAAKDVPAGMTVSGFPAREHRRELREKAALGKLPELVQQVKALVDRVERLETAADSGAGGGV